MTSPSGNIRPDSSRLEDEVRQLRQIVDALVQKPVRNAGDFSIKNTSGVGVFVSGPQGGALSLPDGTPQWVTQIRDNNDVARFAFYDPSPLLDGVVQTLWMWDHNGTPIWTGDNNGGWAEPWFPIPMYAKFSVAVGIFDYMSKAVNGAEEKLWEGRIGYVSHTRVQVDGIWGAASGTNTTRYRLKVNGTTIGTWDIAGLESNVKGPFVFPVAIGTKNTGIEITAQTLSGTGNFACQLFACYQRQT